VLWLIAVAVALRRVLQLAGDHAPALSAAAMLVALLIAVAGLLVLITRTVTRRTSLARAAAEADTRAALKDELKSAYWFIAHPHPSPWTAAQLEHAARCARELDVPRLLPVRVQPGTLGASALISILLLALWALPPISAPSQSSPDSEAALTAGDAKQVQLLRAITEQLTDHEAAAQVEQALRTLRHKGVSPEDKQRALAAAREALEQRNLEAASTREGLHQLAQKLRGNEALKDVAAALEEGDARKAAQALQQAADVRGGAGGESGPPA